MKQTCTIVITGDSGTDHVDVSVEFDPPVDDKTIRNFAANVGLRMLNASMENREVSEFKATE